MEGAAAALARRESVIDLVEDSEGKRVLTEIKKNSRQEQCLGEYHAETNSFRDSDEGQPLISSTEEKETTWQAFKRVVQRKRLAVPRTVRLDGGTERNFCANVVRNQKYKMWSFLFVVLYEQFRFFFNLYFLVVALSQFIPAFQVGFLFTYISPLAFVLIVTILKEAWDDIKRYMRDKEANSQRYKKLTQGGLVSVPSSEIQVGDLIQVKSDQRVPADLVLLRTTEKMGACFIRTDQLDGETDWKLKRAVVHTQKLEDENLLVTLNATVWAEKPRKDIYEFEGNFNLMLPSGIVMETESLSCENTVWANTVVASGTGIGIVIYTGADTRAVMNTSSPNSKVGLLDLEINRLSKVLCALLVILSFLMIALKGFTGLWYIYFIRYMLLFSAIIPISLRVNLDMAKVLYSFLIMRDKNIEGTVVRSSNIPEELGRIEYLLSDKTGTLTQNDMVFKRLHLGSMAFSKEALEEVNTNLLASYSEDNPKSLAPKSPKSKTKSKIRRTITTRVREAVQAIALCHNVTPVTEEGKTTYQASSPDEIALVKFAESVDLRLWNRDLSTISLKNPLDEEEHYEVLNIFPFTSTTKRMGIIVKEKATGTIIFFMKGADSVMVQIVKYNDWLEEECGNMAREGLRTLVFGKKQMSQQEYDDFARRLHEAKTRIRDREAAVQKAVESIEQELDLLCLTGVEDKLQENVRQTLETLANAGIKVWMLTGDKIETAKCIAISAKLVSRNQNIFTFSVKTDTDALQQLQAFSFLRDTCLLIDGVSLQLCLDNFRVRFAEVACRAPCVVCCRCSPTQKAEVVTLIREVKKARTCAIGDGGNDVSMIQAADVGVGIVGKEGKQASLAADFSINQFSYLQRLLLWHGRNSYKRSARLGQFIIHRGLIISFIQAVFSSIFYFAAIAIYNGWLLVGYATFYTMAPVFSLVLDEDVSESIAFRFPELYKELQRGRVLSYKTFFIWVLTSVYQGGVIMIMTLLLFEDNLFNIVSITFTSLILTELLNVAFEVNTWNRWMFASEISSLVVYVISIFVLTGYFDISFILSVGFIWRVLAVTLLSCMPIYLYKFIKKKVDPPSYSKLS